VGHGHHRASDTFSRSSVGWSIDTIQNSNLVVDALDMAIKSRQPEPGGVVHADHGVQFTSWAFTDWISKAGFMPSFGSVGDGIDNAMMESFWSSMHIELLNRKKWRTQIKLANAMFDYIEIFHNRRRRHSKLNYLTPIEFELTYEKQLINASYPLSSVSKLGQVTESTKATADSLASHSLRTICSGARCRLFISSSSPIRVIMD